jgi:hypothetical protein
LNFIVFVYPDYSVHYGHGVLMGKGLLAWWRRRIVARGLVGAALFAVPVAVAALIGFGGGFAGVAGGLSSITSGPDAGPASAQTGPTGINRAVVALASRQAASNGSAASRGSSAGDSNGSSGTTSPSGASGTSGSSGDSSGTQSPVIDTPTTPGLSLPGSNGGGAVSGATNIVNGTVNNVVGGVNNTLNGLLGGGK